MSSAKARRNHPPWTVKAQTLLLSLVIISSRTWAVPTAAISDVSSGRAPYRIRQQQRQQHLRKLLESGSTSTSTTNNVTIAPKIIGGTTADPGEYPWYASPSGTYYCGGTLVHEDVILTAAHCDLAFQVGQAVYVGGYVRGSSSQGAAQRGFVETVLRHPDYDERTVSNDFMLVKLEQPIATIDPIALNQQPNIPATGAVVTTIGYGYTSEDGAVSQRLNEVDLNAVSFRNCRTQYAGITLIDDSVMVCAGYADGGRGSCQGDSGGPLIDVVTGTQVGIVSFGVGCAQGAFPGVYSRVSGAYDWIQDGICLLSDDPPSRCPQRNVPTVAPTVLVPTPSVDDGTQTIKVTIQYDANPEESSFIISRRGRDIYTGPKPSDYVPEPNTPPWTTTFTNFPLGVYTFTMRDTGGNGMDAGPRKGYFRIVQVLSDGTDLELAYGDGVFFWSTSVQFTVEANPQRPLEGEPTPPPSDVASTLCSCSWDATSCLPSVCDAFSQDEVVCEATEGCVWTSNINAVSDDDDGSQSFLMDYGIYIVIAAAVVGLVVFGIVLWKYYQQKSSNKPRSETARPLPPNTTTTTNTNTTTSGTNARNKEHGISTHATRSDRPNLSGMHYAAATKSSSWSFGGSGIDVDGLAYEDV